MLNAFLLIARSALDLTSGDIDGQLSELDRAARALEALLFHAKISRKPRPSDPYLRRYRPAHRRRSGRLTRFMGAAGQVDFTATPPRSHR
jgi:hypothetical protein